MKKPNWLLPNTDGTVSKSEDCVVFSLETLNSIAGSDIRDDKVRNLTTATTFCGLEDLKQAFWSIKRLLITDRKAHPTVSSILADSFSLDMFQDVGSGSSTLVL